MIMYKRKLRDDGSGRALGYSEEESSRKRKRGLQKHDLGSSEDETDYGKHQYSDSSRDGLPSPSDVRYGSIYLDCINSLSDADDRYVWEMFEVLPSKEEYPDYYQIIKEPIDLQTIRERFQSDAYGSLAEMEKDILLMVKNAHAYNEPRSQIYKDASTIKRAILAKKMEIERGTVGTKTNDRMRSRSGPSISADSDLDSIANEDESSSSHVPEGLTPARKDDGTIRDGADDLQMAYYNAIVLYADEMGRVLSEPFLRLPSKRAYPEYYEVIKKPLAMLKIRAKIKAGGYDGLDAIEEDMNTVFNNAQTFNEDESVLHKDAIILQAFACKKKIELMRAEGILRDSQRKQRPKSLEDVGSQSAKKKREVDPKVLRKRMKHLYDTIVAYKDETGRILSDIFVELPSPEDYPEYYKYIKNPIDLKTIDANIKSGKYPREDLLMRDFEAMFLNAKHFNEEESQVYKDAVVLEKVLKKTRKALGPVYGDNPSKQTSPIKTGKTVGSPGGGRRLSGTQTAPNQSQALLSHIKSYRDSSGRVLCGIFEHLPSKSEYPDYYVLIKKPIDLSKIASNVETGKYTSLDDLEQDLLLMFDNACRYNEPDSQIYKDALTLQREMIQKKTELLGYQGDLVPDVPGVVQKLLKHLFDKVMGFKDDEGRCYSDSLLEVQAIPDVGEHENKRTKPTSLSIIGKLLDKGFYSRLDRLQDDVFAVFQKARENSRTDSEMYEDAVELHQYFIQERDLMCRDGQKVVSQALAYGKRQFLSEVEEEKKMKHERELASDEEQKGEDRTRDSKREEILVPSDKDVIFLNEVTLDDDTYRLGDFVYVESSEGKKPHVVVIEKIWTDHQGNRGVYCCWFYRPEETFHLASRKFLEQEVFRSDHFGHISLDNIVGKCCVLHVKDYFRMKPENYKEEDIFVCESKYQVKNRSFKKIKMWSFTPPHIKLRQRDILLTPRRVSSVFALELNKQSQRDNKQTNLEIDEDEVAEYQAELEGKSVKLESPLKDDGNVYFEQFTTATGCYKIGDSVYVRSDEEYPYMSRIDKIWTDVNGVAWFHGNWYLRPEEAKHMPTRMFYEQEVFQSNIEDTNPMASIMGRCCILHIKDYMICRTTELPERDVFLCESRYDEGDGHIRKLKGLKRPSLSGLIRDDEFYYFDEPYLPKKKPSPLLMTKPTLADTDTESVDESKKSIKRIREQAGFALFVSEVGIMLRKTSGDAPEEEVERVAKQEWKNLSGSKKAEYEARARAQGLEPPESDESLLVYECGWRGCNHQYEDIQDLMVHVMENGGHLVKENNEYPCLWMDCIRTKRGLLPFNTHSKLARHVREVHFKVAAKRIQPSEKSRNYFPRHQAAEQSSFDHPMPFTEIQHFEDRTPARTNIPPVETSHLLQKPFLARQVPPTLPMVSQIPIQPPMMPFRPMNVPHPQMTQPQSQPQPIPQPQPPQRMFIPRPHPVSSAPGVISVPMSSAPSEPQQGLAIQQPLTIEQQQLLLQQVQRQQQEIQKLQMQLQLQQTASQQQTVAPEPDSIFIPTPQSTTKLRHSEAYLRYIEGLRDNKQYMSNWNELSGAPNRPQPQAQLPFHWLDEKVFGQAPVADALWELRDHMLKDAISLSRIV